MFIPEQRKQYKLTIDFSSATTVKPETWQALKAIIAQRVSVVVGGCTMLDVQGFWADMPDNRADKGDYSAYALNQELHASQLQVKCEADGLTKLKRAILDAFEYIGQEYPQADIDWVCGSIEQVESFNFSVKG